MAPAITLAMRRKGQASNIGTCASCGAPEAKLADGICRTCRSQP
jgi:hypothetical protein